ncbi:MAG: SPOR domain-containing protein [Muribaculaceae bacterium]|nr:SPOR domain-containing protein [Muribaculaceae bacterium]
MKHSNFKHIMLALMLAIVIVPISLTQVIIEDKRTQQQEPEKKTETSENGGETANKEGSNKEATTEGQSSTANKPSSSSSRSNNSSVNAANNNNYVDAKKPESLNQDYSTGSNSSNLQSQQEVEMRSYGYRILVYHTNKSKNAKANAQKRAKDITMKFPQYQFYFTYKAPTWRLRVGDFVDEESAHLALKQLRKAFPMYSKEMTIIHDNINVWK